MKRVERFRITNNIELLYAKTHIKNLCKLYEAFDTHFLELAVIELGSNILKYSQHGDIWVFLINGKLAIASLDFGSGIEDISIAKKRGYSSLKEKSLGVGLYALSSHEHYVLDILSFTQTKGNFKKGSVLLLHEKSSINRNYFTLSLPLYDSKYNGDFCVQKGRYLFFGDVSGHGKAADNSAKAAINFFHETKFSSLTIEDFLKKLHQYLIEHAYRSLVGCIVETCEEKWSLFGVGNIAILEHKKGETLKHPLPNGIIAESYSALSSLQLQRGDSSMLLLMSDGIDTNTAIEILRKFPSADPVLLALSIIHFAGMHDDRTITILS